MTKKLFDDGMLFSFSAVVTDCNETKNGFEVTLDRSAFFPEGGGQAGDVGTLGGVKVIDSLPLSLSFILLKKRRGHTSLQVCAGGRY